MNTMKAALLLFVALVFGPTHGLAASILGTELESFAVLGASTVTNTGPTSLTGNLGVSPGTAITGFFGTVENDGPGVFTGTAYQGVPFAATANTQLGTVIGTLTGMGAGTLEAADLTGSTLFPGVYTVPAGVTNLTGTLILDGLGDPNAVWVFQMPSTLITSPGSIISLINTGAGAGVYWNVGSSATLGTNTSFAGNILAYASITLDNGATIGYGRALAQTGAVTMDSNVVNSIAAVPEPETYAMMLAGLGLLGFAARRRKRIEAVLSR